MLRLYQMRHAIEPAVHVIARPIAILRASTPNYLTRRFLFMCLHDALDTLEAAIDLMGSEHTEARPHDGDGPF